MMPAGTWAAARLQFEKQAAVSPHLVGAGLGAAFGAWSAPKDRDGRRQGVLQRSLVGAGLGLGAGHLAAHSIDRYNSPVYGPHQRRRSFGEILQASPLGVAQREGLRAGVAGAGRVLATEGRHHAQAAARYVRDTGAAYAADARAIKADPVEALKNVGRGAVAPAANLVRSPVETARKGWDRMGGLGQVMLVAGTAPGAVQDFQQQTDEHGQHRGFAERTLSSASRVAAPLAFAATHPVSDNRITSLIGGQLAERITRPGFAQVGRVLDRATGSRAAAVGSE
jgi:hypothetical protein